jgi:hypothetical protein
VTQPEEYVDPDSALHSFDEEMFRPADDEPEAVTASMSAEQFQSRMPGPLKRYWLRGEGAAKIRWGTPGSFDRCVRNLADDFPQDVKGLCNNLHHEATGHWPGEDKD